MENCKVIPEEKYVARLANGKFIYAIKSLETVETCLSRTRARQFSKSEAAKLKRVIVCVLIRATWEHVEPPPQRGK